MEFKLKFIEGHKIRSNSSERYECLKKVRKIREKAVWGKILKRRPPGKILRKLAYKYTHTHTQLVMQLPKRENLRYTVSIYLNLR